MLSIAFLLTLAAPLALAVPSTTLAPKYYTNPFPPPKPFGQGCPNRLEDRTTCAVVWHDRYCHQQSWQLLPDDNFAVLGPQWNDRIIVAFVQPGCRLEVYEHEHFAGGHTQLRTAGLHAYRSVGWMGSFLRFGISSMKCKCRRTH